MSFLTYSECIKENDTVILYLGNRKLYAVEIKPTVLNRSNQLIDNFFNTPYGPLDVKKLIGKRYGSKIFLKSGHVYVLHPTPELWTATLSHRTQIIYVADISLILFQLDLQTGSIVVEAGTGSGSVTHALARTVAPNGHVYTFEYHENRVATAKKEFKSHGISDIVTIQNADVYTSGFGTLENVADAVFLDLPLPSLAIPHVVKCFKNIGGRFVSFSPCIEQVQNTCCSLRDNGFIDIDTVECLQREFELVSRSLREIDGQLNFSYSPSSADESSDDCYSDDGVEQYDNEYFETASDPECSDGEGDVNRGETGNDSRVLLKTCVPTEQIFWSHWIHYVCYTTSHLVSWYYSYTRK